MTMNRRQFLLATLDTKNEIRKRFAVTTRYALATNKFDGVKLQELEKFLALMSTVPQVSLSPEEVLHHCYYIAMRVAEARI